MNSALRLSPVLSTKGGVKVVIKNLQNKIPPCPKRITKIVLKALSLEKIKKQGEINILLVDNIQIRELNLVYSGRACPTDVLSFDNALNKKEILCDIVVSTDMALVHAKVFKTSPLYEAYLYVVHGLLHILGYDDSSATKAALMQKKSRTHLTLNTQYSIRNTYNVKCQFIEPKP